MTESTQVATVNAADIELLKQFGLNANVQQAEKTNSISIKGGKWRYSIDGQVKTVTLTVDGEEMSAPSVKAIILSEIPTRSYAMFEGSYEDGANVAPTCYSLEGKHPDIDQGATPPEGVKTCAGCPKRIVGSAFINGDETKPTRACKESKRIAVVLAQEPSHTPLKLQLPVTSLWEDKSTSAAKESSGWFAHDAYIKHLAAKGIAHTAMVETTLKFDDTVSSPKVLFKMSGRLPDEAIRKVLPLVNSPEVQKVLGLNREPRAEVAKVEAKPEVVEQPAPAAKVEVAPAPKPAKPAKAEAPKVVEAPDSVGDQLSDW